MCNFKIFYVILRYCKQMSMITKPGKNTKKEDTDKSSEGLFTGGATIVEAYAVAALFCLILAVILITFGRLLIAGCLIVAGASVIVVVLRKSALVVRNLRNSLTEAQLENERKNNIISVFSHKIREPLNNLVIIVDLLRASDLEKKQKEMLDTFIASTNNMVTTVNELTMQSAGGISYEPRKNIKFSIISTLQNTIELFNLKEGANIDFILNRKEFHDLECIGDPVILKQVFLDVFNTVEGSGSERPVKVTINVKREKEYKNEIFIGFRIQTDRKIVLTDEKGIVSLNAVKLISSVNGSFSQESGNNYTVLNIILPFSNPVPEQGYKVPVAEKGEKLQKPRVHRELKDVRLLLVEDNLINQKITHLTLKPLVKSIDTASNGKEAIDKYIVSKYDLILMDIQMPVMNGLVAAEKIREMEAETNAHVPIIAITANAMLGDKEKCMSAGIDDYISKPYTPALLIEKIKGIL